MGPRRENYGGKADKHSTDKLEPAIEAINE
jgi:hypothetical protein